MSGSGEAKIFNGMLYHMIWCSKPNFRLIQVPVWKKVKIYCGYIERRDVTILTHVNFHCDLMFHARFQLNLLSGSEAENLHKPA